MSKTLSAKKIRYAVLGLGHVCQISVLPACEPLQVCLPNLAPASAATAIAITKQESTGVPYLEPLSDKDIADALSAASSVGDDRIQKQATGRINPEQWTHGSSAERQKWFTIGYQTGDPNKCDTFATNNLG